MTKPWLKFVKKRSKKEQAKILEVATKISIGDFENLDIERMSGEKNKFRCRIGNIRIVF
ncbi:MAG: hypothetical protein OEL89_05440 [Candidatus Peregrinibacteria bacterium]|nr:hypothetical protein [Candidatus Peregrinibacteria bacterium]